MAGITGKADDLSAWMLWATIKNLRKIYKNQVFYNSKKFVILSTAIKTNPGDIF
jgi:hypothetical protein